MILDPDNLIIDRPMLQNKKSRISSFITFVTFWAVFCYMLRPAVVLFGWMFMGYFANKTYELDYEVLPVFTSKIVIAIGIMMIVFPLWAFYNKKRFGDANDKRKDAEHMVVDDEILKDFNVPVRFKNTIYNAKQIDFYFDDKANINGFGIGGNKTEI